MHVQFRRGQARRPSRHAEQRQRVDAENPASDHRDHDAADAEPAATDAEASAATAHEERGDEPPRAHRAQLVATVAQRVGDDLARERGDDRQHEDRLRDDHRLGREQDAPGAERAAARQAEVDDEADDHRRQREQRVEQDEDQTATGKARRREPGARDEADPRRDQARRAADRERKRDDAHQRRVGVADQADRRGEAFGDGAHRGKVMMSGNCLPMSLFFSCTLL